MDIGQEGVTFSKETLEQDMDIGQEGVTFSKETLGQNRIWI